MVFNCVSVQVLENCNFSGWSIMHNYTVTYNSVSVLATCIYVVRLMQCCYSLCILQASIPTTLTTVAETVPISNVSNTHCCMSIIIDFLVSLGTVTVRLYILAS